MATFWATFEKIGYFLFQHLVTLEGREKTISQFLIFLLNLEMVHRWAEKLDPVWPDWAIFESFW